MNCCTLFRGGVCGKIGFNCGSVTFLRNGGFYDESE